MNSAALMFIAGLPGCGKTAYLKKLQAQDFEIFDDFKANAKNDSSRFEMSKHYGRLLASLRTGRSCAVADIDFCRVEGRREAESCVRHRLPEVAVQWVFFENDVARCRLNVLNRARPSQPSDLAKLEEMSHCYQVPPGVRVIPVWRPEGSEPWGGLTRR